MNPRILIAGFALFFTSCGIPVSTGGPCTPPPYSTATVDFFAPDTNPAQSAYFEKISVTLTSARGVNVLTPVRTWDSTYWNFGIRMDSTENFTIGVKYDDSVFYTRSYSARDTVHQRLEFSPGPISGCDSLVTLPLDSGFTLFVCRSEQMFYCD